MFGSAGNILYTQLGEKGECVVWMEVIGGIFGPSRRLHVLRAVCGS